MLRTENKGSEPDYKALYEQERKKRKALQAVFETNPSMMWFKDDRNTILRANQTAASALGVEPQQMQGQPTVDFYGEELAEKYLEDDLEVFQSGDPKLGIVEKVLTQSGEHRWVRTDKIPYEDDETGERILIVSARDVSDQIAIREEFEKSKERLELALKGSEVGIWDWFDVEKSEEWWSPEFYKIIGYSEEEIVPSLDAFSSLLHPEDKERAFAAVEQHFEKDIPFDMEYRLKTKSGSYTWVHARAKLFRDESGKPRRMAGTIVDIQLRKRLEAQLKEKDARLEMALDAAQTGIWDWDIENNVLVWDETMFQLYGLSRDDFAGAYAAYESAVHPDDRENVNRDIQAAVDGEKEYNRIFRIIRPDGKVRFIEAQSKAFKNGEGKIVRLIGTNADVTDRVKSKEALEQSEARFRALYESRAIGIFFANTDGDIVEANHGFLDMVGYSHEDLPLRWDRMTPDEWAESDQNAVKQLQEKGYADAWEKEYFHKLGHRIPIQIAVASYSKRKSEQQDNVVCVISDLTAAKEYEKVLERINHDLERFAYVASHDLQEPIRKILSFMSILEASISHKLDQGELKHFVYVKNAALRMRTLIQDLLQYSRAGKLDIKKEYSDLNFVIRETLEVLQLSIQEKNADVQVEGSLPPLVCSKTALGLIFQNLISNAIKFAKKGVAPKISIRASKKEGNWQFAVQDNGIGFDAKHTSRVFEVFQRLHGRSEYSGNGIGLSICKRLVEAHGGEIWVDSEEDFGTTFYFTIPDNKEASMIEVDS